ncbi:MAG: hypothetical protein L3J09_00430 [Flavobacteriaceae bacterium]|nr:hypothetical protein [Flavobacteriaceae bacterium]
MKNSVLYLGLLMSFLTFGQDSKSEDLTNFEKVYYLDKTLSDDDYEVHIKNIIDYKDEIKFSLKITNKTKSFLAYNSQESSIVVNENSIPVTGKLKLIPISKSKSQTIKVDRNKIAKQKNFNILLDGLFVLKENSTSLEVTDFKIPMPKKDFNFGDVTCLVSIPVRKSQKMTIKIEMNNKGKDYIIVRPFRVGLKMPDNNIYTSKNTKEIIALAPQSKKTITLKWDRMPGGNANDMQKVPMSIIFNDVFFTTNNKKLNPVTIEIIWDEELTTKN